MTSSDFLKVKINLKSQGNCKTEVAMRCLGITCRVRHPFVHSLNTHITLLFLSVSCQGTYHLDLGSCVILPAGQCFILIWCPSELCQAGLHNFDFYLQSFLFSFTFLHSSVPLRKPHPIVTCVYFILIKFRGIITWKTYHIHSWSKSIVLWFFRSITWVIFLGTMDIDPF